MSANIRQQIVDAVEAQLKTITPVNGYATDFGARVHVWQVADFDPKTDLPAIVLRDPDDEMPSEGVGNRRSHELALEAVLVFAGDISPAGARAAVADIVRAIGIDPTWGGLAYDTLLTRASLDMEVADRIFCGAEVDFTVRYRTGLWTI